MKCILTAFNGKLSSGVMEWPDEIASSGIIHLNLDMEKLAVEWIGNGDLRPPDWTMKTEKLIPKKARFQSTNKFYVIPGTTDTAAEFVLIEIN